MDRALRTTAVIGLVLQDTVADATRVLLVMRLQAAGAAQNLAVERVLDPVFDHDDDGLVHLVAHDQTLTNLTPAALDWLFAAVLSHVPYATSVGAAESPSSRSRMIV